MGTFEWNNQELEDDESELSAKTAVDSGDEELSVDEEDDLEDTEVDDLEY